MNRIKSLLDLTVDNTTRQRLLDEIKNLKEGDRFNLGINGRVVNEVVFKIEGSHFETLRYGVEGTMLTQIREVIYNQTGSSITGIHNIGTKPYHSLLENATEAHAHA